jgi:hypothetical protein
VFRHRTLIPVQYVELHGARYGTEHDSRLRGDKAEDPYVIHKCTSSMQGLNCFELLKEERIQETCTATRL